MIVVSEQLGDAHDLSAFSCGEASLDEWLRQSARSAGSRHTGRTFVWHSGNGVVVAWYTLVAHSIAVEAAPRSIGRGTRKEIPAILLARLALDGSVQGQGEGSACWETPCGERLKRAASLLHALSSSTPSTTMPRRSTNVSASWKRPCTGAFS